VGGAREVKLPSGAEVGDLLEYLGVSRNDVGVIVINGKDAGFDRPLTDGDRVTLISHIYGG
jgi:sulfur carrier protein ThiS